MPSQPLTTVNWYISATVSSTTYNLTPIPITSEFLDSLDDSEWGNQAKPALSRCNSLTFAKRGFSSSIGYLAFDPSVVVGSTTVGLVLKAIIDGRKTVTLVQQYIDQNQTVIEYYAYRLYIDEAEVFHSQHGYMSLLTAKLVDNRYYAPILAPTRNSTHSFSTYSSDARAKDLFYTGYSGPDWESGSSSPECPTIYEQLCYWLPAFRNWTVTIPNSGPFVNAGINVSPQSETAYGCFRRLVEHCYLSTLFSDLQINSADGHATVVANVPAPTDLTLLGNESVPCGYYRYKTDVSAVRYEVLFPLNRKNVWNTETLDSRFKLRFQSPYTQPTRVPSAAYLAYYPNGEPAGTDECISIIANEDAIPDREASKASGPVGTALSTADRYDFDTTTLATAGDAAIAKYIANNKAYSFFQSKTINGFADPYTYGTVPELICGARFILQDVPTTEIFWGVRFQVRETEGLPYCGVAEPVEAPTPVNANLHLRQLGEQAFEELQLPYSSWSGHTEVKIYGHSVYSGGYNPTSYTTCDALYAMGEAKVVHGRLDENTSETNTYGISETHVLVKSRDLIVGVNFVGYQMNDGHYRPIDQPSIRAGAVQTRWDTAVSPTDATTATNMHVKFLTPYFKETSVTTGNITDPTPLLMFDRHTFRVFDVESQSDYLKTAFATTNAVNPSMAFITSANRVMLGKNPSEIASEASGTVEIYKGTAGSETVVQWGPSGSDKATVTAWNHGTSAITADSWVYVVEINENWYVIPASGGGASAVYWGRTDEAGFKDGVSFTVSVLSGTGTGTDTGTNIEVVSKISDIDSGADCYFTKPIGCDDYHLINGECEVT